MAQMQIRGNTQIISNSVSFDRLDSALQALIGSGVDWKQSCRVATTANITLSGTQTVDGVALSSGDRVLVKNQTTGSQNGIWVCSASTWARATDADGTASTGVVNANMTCFIEEGTTNGDTQWILSTNNPITVGTTSLTFVQAAGSGTTYSAGDGLTLSSTTFNVGAGQGIAVAADSVAVDVAADYGLQFVGNQLAVLAPAAGGMLIDSSGVYPNLGNGLQVTSNAITLKLVTTTSGLSVGAGGLTVAFDTNPGLQSSTGLKIKLDSTPGLQLGSGGLSILFDTNPGLQTTTGLKIKLDTSSQLVLGSGGLKVTATPSFTSVQLSDGLGSAVTIGGANAAFGCNTNNSTATLTWDDATDTTSELSIAADNDVMFFVSGNYGVTGGYRFAVTSAAALTGLHASLVSDVATSSKTYTLPNLTGRVVLSSSLIWNEVPSGSVNGSNTVFTLANSPATTSTMQVSVNGVIQKPTTHYSVGGTGNKDITLGTAPTTGDLVLVSYVTNQ